MKMARRRPMSGDFSDKIDKIIATLSRLDERMYGVEKRFDTFEEEIRQLRQSNERIIRLEEAYKNICEEIDRKDKRANEAIIATARQTQDFLNERIDRKLIALKLAIFTSIAAAGVSLVMLLINILRMFR